MGLFGPPDIEKLKEKNVKGLIKALNYKKDWKVRKSAIDALVKLGDARAVDPLIKALGDGDDDVRLSATEALGKMGDPRAIEPLIGALKSGNAKGRIAAAEALGNIGDPEALAPLVAALKDGDFDLRQAVGEALGKLGEAAVEPLIARFQPKAPGVDAVAEALGRIGCPRAVQVLLDALGDDCSIFRASAVRGLGKTGDVCMVERLLSVLSEDTHWHVRKTAASALEQLGWEPDAGELGALFWIAKGDIQKPVHLVLWR